MSVRMMCPYVFCSASLEAKWMRTHPQNPKAERLMIPEHTIQHHRLTGPCPAGMMWIPLQDEAVDALVNRAASDLRNLEEYRDNPPEPLQTDETARRGGTFPQRPLYPREPGQLPGRMGREPVPKAQSWNPPLRDGPEPQAHENKPGIGGYSQTGRGDTMPSISEMISMTTEANTATGEALSALAQASQDLDSCLGAIERAKGIVAVIVDDSNATTMSEYGGLLGRAEVDIRAVHSRLEEALSALGQGMETGETFIGRLMS